MTLVFSCGRFLPLSYPVSLCAAPQARDVHASQSHQGNTFVISASCLSLGLHAAADLQSSSAAAAAISERGTKCESTRQDSSHSSEVANSHPHNNVRGADRRRQLLRHEHAQTAIVVSRDAHSSDTVFEECLRQATSGNVGSAITKLRAVAAAGSAPSRLMAERLVQAFAARSLPAGVACVKQLPLDSCRSYTALLRFCEARRSLQGIKHTVQTMLADPRASTLRLRDTAAITAFQSLARAAQPQAAEVAFQQYRREKGNPTGAPQIVGNTFLNALSSDTALTFHWYKELQQQGFVPNLISFNTLLKSCMQSRDVGRAAEVAGKIAERGMQGDEYTYNTLIKTFAFAGDFMRAVQVKDDMQAVGFQPTLSLWGSLMVVCGQAGFLEQGFNFWAEMHTQGLQPTEDTYNALMNACADAYQGERAIELFRQMQQSGLRPTLVTYNLAIKACGSPPGIKLSKEQLGLAFGLLDEMKAVGLDPDATSYTSLFTLCSQAKDGRRALQTFKVLENEGALLDVKLCTALITALGTEGLIDEALAVFRKMVWGPARMKPTEKTYRMVTRLCREAGLLEKALHVYKGMRSRGFKPSNAEFRELTQACAEQALKEGQSSALPGKMVELLGIKHSSTLDLHGLSEVEARAAVLCGLLSLQSDYHAGSPVQSDFIIITGSGIHSQAEDGPKLRNAVLQLLCKELRVLKEPPGKAVLSTSNKHGKLLGTLIKDDVADKSNPGRVVIPKFELQQWLSSRRRSEETVLSDVAAGDTAV